MAQVRMDFFPSLGKCTDNILFMLVICLINILSFLQEVDAASMGSSPQQNRNIWCYKCLFLYGSLVKLHVPRVFLNTIWGEETTGKIANFVHYIQSSILKVSDWLLLVAGFGLTRSLAGFRKVMCMLLVIEFATFDLGRVSASNI